MYIKKVPPHPRRRGLFGFGDDNTDAHGCTPDQVWNDTAGACVSLDENIRIINAGTQSQPSGGGGSGVLDTLLKSFFPTPTMTPPMAPSSGGISTTTALLIGGGLLLGAVLLTRK